MTDLWTPASSNLFHRCALASTFTSAPSGCGFIVGTIAPPSGCDDALAAAPAREADDCYTSVRGGWQSGTFGVFGRILADLAGMRMALIAAGVSLAHVCDRGFRVRRLDLERSNERVLGFDCHLIRLVPDLNPDFPEESKV